MNRTLIAAGLGLLATIVLLAVGAGLIAREGGWFIGVALYMISGFAWWVPIGRERDHARDRDSE